jgi:aspartate aminotransferase-like enzyme
VLVIVDAISSLGCLPFATDAWDVDVATTCSQKGFMIPPGLAFITFSQRAWDAYGKSNMAKYYFDAGKYKAYAARGQTPFTPAVSLYYGLDLALEMMEQEGMEQITSRHANLAEYTRNRIKDMGLQMLARPSDVSDSVTSVVVPDGIEAAALLAMLNKEYDVVLAAGQGKLMGKIFRIGHLGLVDKADIDAALEALASALDRLGYKRPAATTA